MSVTANNTNSNFLPVEGEWEMIQVPFKASVAMEDGTAVSPEISSNDVTGYLGKMGTENATGSDFFGIIAEAITSSDDDYATAGKLKSVWVPTSRYSRAYFSPDTGSLAATDVFRTVEIGADSKSLNIDTAGKGARIVQFLNTGRGICTFDLPATETA